MFQNDLEYFPVFETDAVHFDMIYLHSLEHYMIAIDHQNMEYQIHLRIFCKHSDAT